ncbi:hypothetical protein NDU88_008224 [Pleurodeles waltl]|uniref:Uncharacterized protein n=1 Tax=Pleurodeles waltl TaxID=8319 RepID=A0AAV7QR67_PLEWA|nr:hypothetical protein NDU88_008224 [Pleurodeles waltl]
MVLVPPHEPKEDGSGAGLEAMAEFRCGGSHQKMTVSGCGLPRGLPPDFPQSPGGPQSIAVGRRCLKNAGEWPDRAERSLVNFVTNEPKKEKAHSLCALQAAELIHGWCCSSGGHQAMNVPFSTLVASQVLQTDKLSCVDQ